jgi:hypothetical protein
MKVCVAKTVVMVMLIRDYRLHKIIFMTVYSLLKILPSFLKGNLVLLRLNKFSDTFYICWVFEGWQ